MHEITPATMILKIPPNPPFSKGGARCYLTILFRARSLGPTFRTPAIRNQHISEHTVHQAD